MIPDLLSITSLNFSYDFQLFNAYRGALITLTFSNKNKLVILMLISVDFVLHEIIKTVF